jgi:hypothetical protein
VEVLTDPVTLTFNSNGGSAINAVTVEKGKNVTAPTQPTKQNHRFLGWYFDNDTFLQAVTFPLALAESRTIFAKWVNEFSLEAFAGNYETNDNHILGIWVYNYTVKNAITDIMSNEIRSNVEGELVLSFNSSGIRDWITLSVLDKESNIAELYFLDVNDIDTKLMQQIEQTAQLLFQSLTITQTQIVFNGCQTAFNIIAQEVLENENHLIMDVHGSSYGNFYIRAYYANDIRRISIRVEAKFSNFDVYLEMTLFEISAEE